MSTYQPIAKSMLCTHLIVFHKSPAELGIVSGPYYRTFRSRGICDKRKMLTDWRRIPVALVERVIPLPVNEQKILIEEIEESWNGGNESIWDMNRN